MSFKVYRSSAGSGKTFTLVKEYLKIILLNPVDFRNILAITFTNKAANEMKERVLKALKELSKGDSSGDKMVRNSLLPHLISETGLPPHEIALNAAAALEMILHNYADFAIGTIDSFSHKLIRTFAYDFRLPVNFNVELDADDLLATAIDLLLDRVGNDKDLTELLVRFLETRLDEDKGWNIREILTGFARILLDEEGQERITPLKNVSLGTFNQIAQRLYADIRSFEIRIRAHATKGAGILKTSGLTSSDFYQGDRGVWSYFMHLSAGRMEKLEPNSYVTATMEEDKWFSGKATDHARDTILLVKSILQDIYEQIRRETEEHKPDYALRKLLSKTIYPLAVINEIEKALSEFKRQNNIVHISEFNARIAGIVMNEPVPFIYERLGEKFRHILIDEFQDTSVLQWLNFIPLIENALAGGHMNLVVGDGKQAIYRWRGGEVEQFNALPAIPESDRNKTLKQREQSLQRHFMEVNLERNYRSKAEVVDFNNRFFRIIAGSVLNEAKKKVYEALEQQYEATNNGGYIALEFLQADSGDTDYEGLTFTRVQSIIEEARQQGFNLRDMAILCRSNKNASVVARFLLSQGIAVVSAESLLISNSASVRFLVACLRWLFEPPNDIVAEELRLFLQRSHNETLAITAADQTVFASLPVYDLCEALMRHYRLDPVSDPYLRFFLDAVLKFTVKISTGAVEFLDWWERKRANLSIIVPEELDAVRIMTIHKAKGLEFPLVILPFAQESRKNTRTYLWVGLENHIAPGLKTAILRSDKEMESTVFSGLYEEERQKSMLDLLNLLYVSMTRAEERLYILTKPPPKKLDEVSSLPGFFRLFLQQESLWDDDKTKYEFGTMNGHKGKATGNEKATIVPLGIVSADWRLKVEIRLRASQAWDIENPLQSSQWGNRIHTVLSWVITEKDIPTAIEKAILKGLLDVGEAGMAEGLLRSVVADPKLSGLFSERVKVKTEAEILLPQGSFYRPDRIVIDNQRVTVVDYKTGKPLSSHREQLVKYAGYLGEMGYQDIRRLLVYLGPELNIVEA